MEQADINEIALMSFHAKESGFNRVEIDPSDLYELCCKVADMRKDLLDWQKMESMKLRKSTGLNWDKIKLKKELKSRVYE